MVITIPAGKLNKPKKRICIICKKEFIAHSSMEGYCSDECRKKKRYLNEVQYVKGKGAIVRKKWREKYNIILRERRNANRKSMNEYYRNRRHNIRKRAVNRLGGKCNRCGFDDYRALQIDHINGGGTKEYHKLGDGKIYKKILELPLDDIKKEYQILCANCNWIKRTEKNETSKRKYLK